MWTAVTGALPSGAFDSFKSQSLAAALDDDLDGYELVKAHATLAYGDLRGIDKVYIAMVQAGTDEALLFEGLARCNPNTIEADFRDYEFRKLAFSDNATSIWDALDSELNGEDYRRALALLDREPNPEFGTFSVGKEKTRRLGGNMRLVALVKAAVHGLGTNVELIMTAIDEATQPEREELKKQVEDPKDPLDLRGTFGDLSGGELARLRAKLGIKETPGDAAGHVTSAQLNDPTTQVLRGLGGTDVSNVYETIKSSAGATWARFKTEYEKRGTFNDYVWQNTTSSEKAYLQTTIFNTDLDTRLHFCFGALSDDEDYLFHLLGNFASNADKRRLAGDEKWMDRFRSNLSSSEMSRVITLLKPSDLTPQENAKWISQAVQHEKSGFFDIFSSTGAAVQDENRELKAGTTLAGLDANMSPEERKLLEGRAARTEGALQDYAAARDEFANTASMIANVAVSVIIAGLTGGTAGPILLAQLARAAAAMAVAKVLTEKVIRGDRFDIIGSDGAVAFATGAVEGIMNVSGGLAAKGVVGSSLEAVGLSAQQASGSLFRGAARARPAGGHGGRLSGRLDLVRRHDGARRDVARGHRDRPGEGRGQHRDRRRHGRGHGALPARGDRRHQGAQAREGRGAPARASRQPAGRSGARGRRGGAAQGRRPDGALGGRHPRDPERRHRGHGRRTLRPGARGARRQARRAPQPDRRGAEQELRRRARRRAEQDADQRRRPQRQGRQRGREADRGRAVHGQRLSGLARRSAAWAC